MFNSKKSILLALAIIILAGFGLLGVGSAFALDCDSDSDGNWSAAGTWTNCGGGAPGESDTATITHTVTVDQDTTTTDVTINSGGKLQFQTSATGVVLTINDDGNGSLLTVGASGSAGELECRSPSSGSNILRLNSTSSDVAVGVQVESQGTLDIQGTSATDRDCIITNGGVTLDGTRDGYIYLKDGSETLIKYAEISYMGADSANKYGFYANGVDMTESEGLMAWGCSIHNSYDGINLDTTTGAVIYDNVIYDNSNTGVVLNVSSNNSLFGNIIDNSSSSDISLINGDSNSIYNNTIYDAGDDGIALDADSNSNVIKNNLITNSSAEGIDDDGSSGQTIDYNYYYNNTSGACSSVNGSCDSTTAAGSGNDPGFLSTDPTNASFMYLDSDESTSAGPLGAGVELWGASPASPGYINVGSRAGYVKNITDDEEFNWLQDAHDDGASKTLGAGDTVTAYAKDYFSDTITAASSFGSYFVKFNISSTDNIDANNEYEGMYMYFTFGSNRGKYYLITDTANASPDTITIYSPSGAASSFIAGDSFVVVDRAYTEIGKTSDCGYAGGGSASLCLTKNGSSGNPITWNTSGTVIVDGQDKVGDVIYLYIAPYSIIDGFVIENGINSGSVAGIGVESSNFCDVINNTVYSNRYGIRSSSSAFGRVADNLVFSNGYHGISINSNYNVIANNIIYGNGGQGIAIYSNTDNLFYGNRLCEDISLFGSPARNLFIANYAMCAGNYGFDIEGGSSNTFIRNVSLFNGDGFRFYDGDNNYFYNNIAYRNSSDGFTLGSASTGNTIKNNIIVSNSDDGIDDNTAAAGSNDDDYNLFFGNGTAYEGPGQGSNNVSADPDFIFDDSGTADADSSTTRIEDDGQGWANNEWVGYAVKVSGASCPAGNGVWRGIKENDSDTLIVHSAYSLAVDANCTFEITRFYLNQDSPALAAGADVILSSQPAIPQINIGARLGYIKNSTDNEEFNFLQQAEDAASYGPGDTLTVYGYEYVSSGAIGSTLSDLGFQIRVDISEDVITADLQHVGIYMYMTSGTNSGNYYLIIYSDENASGEQDRINLWAEATTGFTAGDTFKIVDRIYDKQGDTANGANLGLSTSGNTASGFITWDAEGTVIITADDTDADITADWGYNLFAETGLDYVKFDKDFKLSYVQGSTASIGGAYNDDDADYYVFGSYSSGGVLTMQAWIRPTDSIASKALFVKDAEYRMFSDASSKLNCQIFGPLGWQTAAVSADAIELNKWSYISCVYDRSNIKVFINGVLQASQTTSNVDVHNSTSTLDLGYDAGGSYGDFQGYIDEFKFYKYARSADQIKSDYTGKATPKGASSRSVTVGEQRDASEGLVAHWKMDETFWNGTASEVIGSSGNANHGTAVADATTTATAKYGRAGTFDGTGDYVDVGDITATDNLTAMTVSAWIKLNSNSARSSAVTKLHKDWSEGWGLFPVSYDGGNAKLWITGTNYFASKKVPTGQWVQMVATFTANDRVKIYFNGVLDTDTATTKTSTGANSWPLYIGAMERGGATDFLNGQIDDVKIWNVARSAEQIRKDYETGPPPVAHWKMDENTGQYAQDTSGNNNTGTLGSGATADSADPTWQSGKFGSALSFDGSDDYVDRGTGPTIVNTVAFWVYPATTTEYPIDLNGTAYIWFNAGTAAAQGFTSPTIYVNGVQTTAIVADTWQHIAVITDTALDASDLDIGRIEGVGYHEGKIDDVRIYNYARTPKQIMEDMNAGHPAVGSPVGSYVAYWPFDEGYGTTVYDKSINQKNLTLSAEAGWTSSGKYGGAFDGADNRRAADGADDNDLDFTAADDFTLSAWVKYGTGNPSATEYILHKQTGFEGYALYMDTDGDLIFGIGDTSSASFPEDTAGNIGRDYADGAWHHIVGVKTSNSRIDTYVDGVLIGSDTSLAADGTLANSATLYIGDANATDGADEFLGDIDEVKIYRFALSPAEIKQEFNQGATLKLGSKSTASDGTTVDDSAAREYCIPGDTSTCDPPVAHWKFDEKTGDTAYDTSGTNNGDLAGTCPGGTTCPTWKSAASCHEGACLSFDGSNDYVDPSLIMELGDPDLQATISFWARGTGRVITTKRATENTGDAQLQIESDGSLKYVIDNLLAPPWIESITSAATSDTAQWNFYALIANGSGDQYYLAVNGIIEQVSKNFQTGQQAYTDILIGWFHNHIWGDSYFNGLIDEVRIYDYARTPAQIAWDYNRGGPIAHWKMDEGQDTATTCDSTGSTVYDSGYSCLNGGACNNGTLSLTPAGNTTPATAWVEGKYNCALDFDGTDDYVYAADNAIFSFGNSTAGTDLPFSISSWVKMDDATNFRVVSKRQSAAAREYTFFTNASDKLEFYAWDNSASAYLGRSYNTALTSLEGQWAHLTATYDGTASASGIKLYLNGIRVDDTNDNSGTYVAMENLAAQLEIGRSVEASTYYSNGQIDDTRIYNYALTAQQIKTLYNENAAVRFGPTEGLP